MSSTVAVSTAWRGWAPWTDRKGRLHPLRAGVFVLLLLPGLSLAVRWQADMLGARPLNALIHGVGYWAAWLLLASLMVTPAKAVLALPNLGVVRRMVGNAALAYAAIHLLLYITDQNWKLLHVAAEILLRFYLTIGFVTLVGLGVLGFTSTDGWARRLGRGWKRLHRIVYGLALLAMVHFFLQTKVDISVPLLAAGVFFWLMLWRLLPAGKDRGPIALIGLAVAAALLTLATEYAWFRFATRIDPLRVLRSELDIAFGLRPAAQVLTLGLALAAVARLRAVAQGRLGQQAWFTVAVFASAAWVGEAASFVFGLVNYDAPEGRAWLVQKLVWMALLGLLGVARWMLRDSAHRRLIDLLGIACAAYLVVVAAGSEHGIATGLAAVLAALWMVLAWRTLFVSKAALAALAPAGLLLAYGFSGLW